MIPHNQKLSSDELLELERFLASPSIAETSLDIFGLEGFFTAILLAPKLIMPSQWLAWVWDSRNGANQPEFSSFEEAQRTINLVMGFYNMVASHLATDPEVYEPRLDLAGGEEAGAWRAGFTVGMRFDRESWDALAASNPEWLEPILSLGTAQGGAKSRPKRMRRWTREVGLFVATIHDHWLSRRLERPPGTTRNDFSFGRQATSSSSRAADAPPATPRAGAKVGRNELCPCGSGRKHKRCCGASRSF